MTYRFFSLQIRTENQQDRDKKKWRHNALSERATQIRYDDDSICVPHMCTAYVMKSIEPLFAVQFFQRKRSASPHWANKKKTSSRRRAENAKRENRFGDLLANEIIYQNEYSKYTVIQCAAMLPTALTLECMLTSFDFLLLMSRDHVLYSVEPLAFFFILHQFTLLPL